MNGCSNRHRRTASNDWINLQLLAAANSRERKSKSLGYHIVMMRELFARGFADVLAVLREKLLCGEPITFGRS